MSLFGYDVRRRTVLDGTVQNPGVNFLSEEDCGVYVQDANTLGFSTDSTRRMYLDNNGLYMDKPIFLSSGTASTPGICWGLDQNSGIFHTGTADTIALSTGGTQRLTLDTVSLTSTVPILAPSGSVSSIPYSFSADTNTGMYRSASDEISFACGGEQILYMGSNYMRYQSSNTTQTALSIINSSSNVTWQFIVGGSGFAGAPVTGFMGLLNTISGTYVMRWNGTQNLAQAGSASLPSYSFVDDPDVGLYRSATNELSVATGGVQRMAIGINGLTVTTGETWQTFLGLTNTSNSTTYQFVLGGSTNTGGDSAVGNGLMGIYTGSAIVHRWSSTQNLGRDGSASAPSYSFYNDSDTGVFRYTTDQMGFTAGGTCRYLMGTGSLCPLADNAYTCGANGNRWSAVWSANGTIQTSDQNMKEAIENSDLGLDFINRLTPKKYRWKPTTYVENKEVWDEEKEENVIVEETKTITPVRKHYGLIAQDVKEVLDELKINTQDFGGYVDTTVAEPNKPQTYGLNYVEFIAPLIKAVQELSVLNNNLTTELNALKARVEVLEGEAP